MAKRVRYQVTLNETMNARLTLMAAELGVSKAEVVRRSLALFKEAVDSEADHVLLTYSEEDGRKPREVIFR